MLPPSALKYQPAFQWNTSHLIVAPNQSSQLCNPLIEASLSFGPLPLLQRVDKAVGCTRILGHLASLEDSCLIDPPKSTLQNTLSGLVWNLRMLPLGSPTHYPPLLSSSASVSRTLEPPPPIMHVSLRIAFPIISLHALVVAEVELPSAWKASIPNPRTQTLWTSCTTMG